MSEMRPDIVAGPIDRKCSFSNCWATGVAVCASSGPPARAAATAAGAMRRTTRDMWWPSNLVGRDESSRFYLMTSTPQPIATFGLTHIALGVRDVERAFAFYDRVFGMVAVYRGDGFLQAQTPGARDVIVFETAAKSLGKSGGIAHFGFRLMDPASIDT